MRKMPNDVERLDRISNAIDADGKGNAEVRKDLTIDGNLKFKSLVSDSNPEGVFDPSSGGTEGGGGGTLYNHYIEIHYLGSGSDNGNLYFNYISKNETQLTLETLKTVLQGAEILCNGYIYSGNLKIVSSIYGENNALKLHLFDTVGVGGQYIFNLTSDSELVSDKVFPIN